MSMYIVIFINKVGYVIYKRINFFDIIFGSREEEEVTGLFVFSHIRIRGYFRLG